MSDDKKAQIFSFRSRKETTVEEVLAPGEEVVVEGNEGLEVVRTSASGLYPPCADTLRVVENFYDQAESGRIQGLCAIAWNQKHRTFDRCILLPKVKTEDAILMIHAYLGALRALADDLSSHLAEITAPEDIEDGA